MVVNFSADAVPSEHKEFVTNYRVYYSPSEFSTIYNKWAYDQNNVAFFGENNTITDMFYISNIFRIEILPDD